MDGRVIKKTDLPEYLKSLSETAELYVPVTEKQTTGFKRYEGRIDLSFSNTRLSPKDFFFPQTEKMFTFNAETGAEDAFIIKDIETPQTPKILFGIRPCDAKAFDVLDRIFTNQTHSDPFWRQKRESTVLVGLGCNAPCPTCFCTSVGSGPFETDGLDVLAYDLGEKIVFESVSEKGGELLKALQGGVNPEKADLEVIEKIKQSAEQALENTIPMGNLEQRSVIELFEADHWAVVQERCQSCGVCTYVCPTCHCFDIQDETLHGKGLRLRNWDTCMSWLFTVHGTGHNPRPDQTARVRQRFMHKFKYIPMKRDGNIGCVGCGRCVTACPVNIDVREVIVDMNR